MSQNRLDELVNLAYKAFFNPSKKSYDTKPQLIKDVLADNSKFKVDRESEMADELLESLFNSYSTIFLFLSSIS